MLNKFLSGKTVSYSSKELFKQKYVMNVINFSTLIFAYN